MFHLGGYFTPDPWKAADSKASSRFTCSSSILVCLRLQPPSWVQRISFMVFPLLGLLIFHNRCRYGVITQGADQKGRGILWMKVHVSYMIYTCTVQSSYIIYTCQVHKIYTNLNWHYLATHRAPLPLSSSSLQWTEVLGHECRSCWSGVEGL